MFGLGKRRPVVEFIEPPHEPTAAERQLAAERARISAAQQVVHAYLDGQRLLGPERWDQLLVDALLEVRAALAPPPVIPGSSS